MAQTFSQSQLTPLASLQFLRPYTKEQVSALTPDESGKLFSLGDLGKQFTDTMFGFEPDPATVFTPEYMNQVASGKHGLPPWAPPWLQDKIVGSTSAGGSM